MMVGEVVHCPSCGAYLEVVEVDPVVLEPHAKIEADEEDFVER